MNFEGFQLGLDWTCFTIYTHCFLCVNKWTCFLPNWKFKSKTFVAKNWR